MPDTLHPTRLELGLDTFGDVTHGADGRALPDDQVLRNVLAEGILADQTGADFFGVGEHHRADFAVSTPETMLAALAVRTSRIRLGSAVTVLSSDDPVRVFQRFSTVAALSEGRAEVILGRGSFTESFPLFGYDLSDYEQLFVEKLDLFVRLLREKKVSWQGTTRAPLKNQSVFPRLPESGLPVWIGVGGSPESVVRAVAHDLPVMLAIIGGAPSRFRPFAQLYREAWEQTGQAAKPLGVHSPGFVADTDEAAKDVVWPHFRDMMNRIGRERGWSPMSREQFEREVTHGALHVGSPETVAKKIAATVTTLGAQRFDMKYSHGTLPHEANLRCIELYGTKVIPMVREMVAEAVA
ncbi:LLM class flavin-dependent oxidoreductase [Wenxinia marina]|uniref:Putative oxidoreductase, LLM family n=1 Tax=Wenxinia marina DSM 24838 TaxID=1123501 RepID=A0A0D0QGZ0_9RHOB|nr:LLM class flavin-dependent oxidoreductase [Wenxinia marina]KIQ70293.1 putative oxidoreductase, LLM family [Wenxinia marina DSM 24838]GGL54238.1 oxidoreductase [Wenxinia marina]